MASSLAAKRIRYSAEAAGALDIQKLTKRIIMAIGENPFPFNRPDFTSEQQRLKSLHEVRTTLDRDEDGVWIAECPSIPGCVSQGDTHDEALANIREAIVACLEVRAERGMPLTIETQQVEVAV